MTGMVILDVVIGVVFVYLLLALLCTAINEWIANLASLRAANLREGMARLLGDRMLQQLVYEHPLIVAVRQDVSKSRLARAWAWIERRWTKNKPEAERFIKDPSYLGSDVFVGTTLDLFFDRTPDGKFKVSAALDDADLFEAKLKEAMGERYHATLSRITGVDVSAAAKTATEKAEELRQKVVAQLKGAMRAATGSEELDFAQVQQRLGGWFDASMERVSGWYKRRIQCIGIVVALLVALAFNASTTTMVAVLAQDQDLRAQLAAVGETAAKVCSLDQLKNSDDPVCGIYVKALRQDKNKKSVALPLGWYESYLPGKPVVRDGLSAFWNFVIWLIGIVATALAASLGAPFWFEILQKVAKIRSSGANPLDRKKAEAGA